MRGRAARRSRELFKARAISHFLATRLRAVRKLYEATLRRGPHERRILALYYRFNANISFTFEAVKNLYGHPTYLCFGSFCKFFGDF